MCNKKIIQLRVLLNKYLTTVTTVSSSIFTDCKMKCLHTFCQSIETVANKNIARKLRARRFPTPRRQRSPAYFLTSFVHFFPSRGFRSGSNASVATLWRRMKAGGTRRVVVEIQFPVYAGRRCFWENNCQPMRWRTKRKV